MSSNQARDGVVVILTAAILVLVVAMWGFPAAISSYVIWGIGPLAVILFTLEVIYQHRHPTPPKGYWEVWFGVLAVMTAIMLGYAAVGTAAYREAVVIVSSCGALGLGILAVWRLRAEKSANQAQA